jgi:hypothetical protein
MREQASIAGQQLYQSEWWKRLASFTENSDRQGMSDTLQVAVVPPEKSLTEQTKVRRTFDLSSVGTKLRSMFLFRGFTALKSERLITSAR